MNTGIFRIMPGKPISTSLSRHTFADRHSVRLPAQAFPPYPLVRVPVQLASELLRNDRGHPLAYINKGAQMSPLSSIRKHFDQVPARSSMACNNTLQPAAMCSGVADSISLWLMPSLHGMKIMPVGASLAIYTASCPAPETAGMLE